MKKLIYVLVLMVFVFSIVVLAADFKPYPGAKVDEKATKEARDLLAEAKMTKSKATIYTSNDSFDKVYAFYKGMAKEYKMPEEGKSKVTKTKSGLTLKDAYFIFDGAADLSSSKLWIKIQRPYIGKMKDDWPDNAKYLDQIYDDIRDVTAIILSEQK